MSYNYKEVRYNMKFISKYPLILQKYNQFINKFLLNFQVANILIHKT